MIYRLKKGNTIKYYYTIIKTATTRNAIAADGILQYNLKSARLQLDIDGCLDVLLATNTYYSLNLKRY